MGAATAKIPSEAVKQGKGQKQRRKDVLERMAFRHGGTGREMFVPRRFRRCSTDNALCVLDRRIIDDGIFVRTFQLEDDGGQRRILVERIVEDRFQSRFLYRPF